MSQRRADLEADLAQRAAAAAQRPQPREWFVAVFGSKALNNERTFVNRFADAVSSICLEEGVLLCDKPFRSAILEGEDVQYLVGDIRDAIDRLQRKHYEGAHMPLVLVINDQTLIDLHEEHVAPNFENEAFIYSIKGHTVKEFAAMDKWDQVRADMRELSQIMEEFNALGPLPVQAPAAPRSRRHRDDEYDRRRPDDDRYGDRSRSETPILGSSSKTDLTTEVVDAALRSVFDHPNLLINLAEDMDAHVQFSALRELPTRPKELVDLLELFVLCGENRPPGLAGEEKERGVRLRKHITETALKSRLLNAVRDAFMGGLHDRVAREDISKDELLQHAKAIHLLLRAFLLLSKHNIIENDALDLWTTLEQPIFSLPGDFWRAISPDLTQRLCKLAADVTRSDIAVYRESVRVALEAPPPVRADDRRAARQNERGGRRDEEGASTSQYRYDPYDVDDESDTTEKYGRGEKDGYGRRSRSGSESGNSTPNEATLEFDYGDEAPPRWMKAPRDEEDDDPRPSYKGHPRRDVVRRERDDGRREREEAERRRWEEEERRRRDEEDLRLREEAAAKEREYERRVQHQAMQQLQQRQQQCKEWEESNEPCIAWHDNDTTEPPVSFRTLAIRPVYSDLYRPKAPYMRRALIDGAYSDNEHYLDVQYRLMREDMVAPLRDGIYEQKMRVNEGEMIPSSNELKIYPTIQVGALQVRSIDGLPMRIVQIPQHMLHQIREERQLKFGQCVVISSDRFCREFHVGWICDRFQDPGLPWSGRLAISFFDECMPLRPGTMPIDKNATFALAESPAYLEAYTHVLRVLKKMRKNIPFPLERYLVSMKKNTRLPKYMISRARDEDAAEDKEREIMYSKKGAEARKKADDAKKKMAERQSRSGSRDDDDDEAEEHVTTEEGVSEECLVDDGFNTDEEDAFLTGGRHTHPNPKDLETIAIMGRQYSVDKLEEQFKSEKLDETQRKAMCYALTSELAIIQGPPGTGKTHIGVEIVMAILENRIKWRMTEPLLIVTFSNQALDHFLDKIRVQILERGLANEDAPSVVRLGSRSDHDAIKLNCLLSTVMKDYEEDLAGESMNERIKARKAKQHWLEKLMRAVKTVQLSRRSILNFQLLRASGIMDPNHEMQLAQASNGLVDTCGNKLNMDETLVSWLLNKSYERKRDLPPGSDSDQSDEWGGGVPASAVNHKLTKKHKAGGRETKKEKNERKRAEKRAGRGRKWNDDDDSSDSEDDDDESPDALPSEVNEEFEGDDEDKQLQAMLDKINANALRQQSSAATDEKWRRMAEKYEMNEDWEVEKEYAARMQGRMLVDDVEIFSRTTKPGLFKGRGKDNQVNVDPNIIRDIHEHKQYILSKEAMTAEEAATVRDVRTMPKEQRWRLMMYWQDKLAARDRNSLDALVMQHERACVKSEAVSDIARAGVLKKALVIGATTTGSAKRRALIARIAPKVLVVEEAAEVLEAHLLASVVPSVQHAIFIGDHQQLRPSTAVHQLAKMANMEVSLFERLVKNGYPFHTLGLQHRMLAPLTAHVVKPFFYNSLKDAPSIFEYPSVRGMATNLFFWAHEVPEDTVMDSMSKRNIVEAEMCRNLANYLVIQGQYRPQEITIIGMYGAQVVEIRRQLERSGGAVGDVAVETVDSFQGKENRVMILSLVRSRSGSVGFLSIPNRITVALTRAQHGMYVCGNFKDIAYYSQLWANIVGSLNAQNLIDYALPLKCQQHDNITHIKVNKDFELRSQYGGCNQACGYLMHCGHACRAVCHPPHQHQIGPTVEGPSLACVEPCAKHCPKCGTKCPKRCQDACGTCHAIVTLELGCGHAVRCDCGGRNLARCKEPCAVELDCGHLCANKCSVECVNVDKCDQGVDFKHPRCNHNLVLPCSQVRPFNFGFSLSTPACYEKCPERLVCGHKCPLKCGETCPTMCEQTVTFEAPCGHKLQKKCSEDARHVKCTAIVDSDMPHCSHRIKMDCYQSRNQNECRSACKKPTSCGHECSLSCGECFKRCGVHECGVRCPKQLPCGHPCHELCGKPCICSGYCRVHCAHQRCGGKSGRPGDKGDSLTYGRACSKPCVQCIEPCDNHCEHRSCSKKCFEECDVRACSKPCGKALRCGHGCLGLCGEPCPRLCGTCSTTSYKAVLERFPDEESVGEVARLLQMPDCEHIIPYKFMDKHAKRQLDEGGIVLRCPQCNGMIEDCKRYIRQTKRLWAEADTRKWEKRMAAEDMSRAELGGKYVEMRNQIVTSQTEVAALHKVKVKYGVKRERFAMDAFRQLESQYSALWMALAEAASSASRAEYYYWQAIVSCHKTVCALVLDYLAKADELRVEFVHDRQPMLAAVMSAAFGGRRSRIGLMREAFAAMTEAVKSSLEHRRVGVLVPRFRDAAIRCHLHYHMEHLNASMRGVLSPTNGEPIDLMPSQKDAFMRVIKSILNQPPSDLPKDKLEQLMKKISEDVYARLLPSMAAPSKTFKVELPDF